MSKYSILLSLLIIISSSCNDVAKEVGVEEQKADRIPVSIVNNPSTASGKVEAVSLPILDFEKMKHDFGDIKQGETSSYNFVFTNTGEADLLISNAKGSCGCTVPEWPKKPIPPGRKGEIQVTFNSNGRQGKQQKTVTLVTNSIPNTKVLTIIGNVIVPSKKSK